MVVNTLWVLLVPVEINHILVMENVILVVIETVCPVPVLSALLAPINTTPVDPAAFLVQTTARFAIQRDVFPVVVVIYYMERNARALPLLVMIILYLKRVR
jgi:hypothetical protein